MKHLKFCKECFFDSSNRLLFGFHISTSISNQTTLFFCRNCYYKNLDKSFLDLLKKDDFFIKGEFSTYSIESKYLFYGCNEKGYEILIEYLKDKDCVFDLGCKYFFEMKVEE